MWEKTTAVGNKIRELKSAKAAKDVIMKEVEALKALKDCSLETKYIQISYVLK